MYSNSLFLVLLLTASFGYIFAVENGFENQTCEQSGFTLECNYIPTEIPKNVTVVRIKDWFQNFNKEGVSMERTCSEDTFQSNSWENVTILEINNLSRDEFFEMPFMQLKSKCFFPLKALEELHIQSYDFFLAENAFEGLEKLKLLDLHGCRIFDMEMLNRALNGTNKVPNLSEISLSNATDYIWFYLNLDDAFADALADKPVKKIDASGGSHISILDLYELFTKIKQLKIFNVSRSKIDFMFIGNWKYILPQPNLTTVDLSYSILPANFLYITFPEVINLSNVSFDYASWAVHTHVELMFISSSTNSTGIIPVQTTIWLDNFVVNIYDSLNWHAHEIILNKNNFRRLNCPIVFGNNTIPTQKLGLAENLMEFLHPSVLAIAPNLQVLDLSGNRLYKMEEENDFLFETLLHSLRKLKSIDLSENGLKRIPRGFFKGNLVMEKIDLSNNDLDAVTFDLGMLENLQVLDLHNNKIARLSQDSLNNFDSLLTLPKDSHTAKLEINFDSNPITCSICEDKDSVDWLLKTMNLKATKQNLSCTQENGLNGKLNGATVEHLQKLCKRKVILLASTITAACALLLLTTISTIIYKRKQVLKKREKSKAVLNLLQNGESSYEFVAFFGYSSDDEDFVNTHVINQINQTLQQMTGIDRNLVCTGDQYFRPGHMLHDEIATCLERVCVLVVLVTDSYCTSNHCLSEFDQGHLTRKPIILMFHENICEELMPPAMKQLYRKNARILWVEDNGQFILKTSWENVCSSILDLIT